MENQPYFPGDPNQPGFPGQQASGYQPLFQQNPQQPYQPLFSQTAQNTGYQQPLNPAAGQPAYQQPVYAQPQAPVFAQNFQPQAIPSQPVYPAQPTGFGQPPVQNPYQPVPPVPQGTGYQAPGYDQPIFGHTSQQTVYPPPVYDPNLQQMPAGQPMPGMDAAGGQPPVYPPATEGEQAPETPPSGGKPAPDRDKIRRIVLRVLIVLIVLAALAGGWFLYSSSNQKKQSYAVIKVGLLGSRYSGDALIVRNEVPYNADGVTSIEYVAEEGKTVSRGMSICNVFSSGYSTKEMSTLQTYRDQIRDYQISLINAETTYDARMAKVETDIMSRAREVRDIISGTTGNLINQEKLLSAAVTARQNYLKQKYAEDQRLTRLYDDEQAQQQRIDSWTKPYVAAADSIVSFYSDGYEYGLTGSSYEEFTPGEVRSMINGQKPSSASIPKSKTTIYRTIQDGEWYVLFLANDANWMPVEGESYELQLEHFENTQVSATVVSTTRSGGELLVRMRVNDSVNPVLYMRSCQAEIGDTTATLQVPRAALYTQDEMQGVVVVDGGNQYFVPVQVVYQSGDQIYISAITAGLLYEGQTIMLFK